VSAELLLLGVSQKTAPVGLRERVALGAHEATAFLHGLVAVPAIREAVVLSTCNRTELLLVVADPVAAETAALGTLAARAGIRPTELAEVVYAPRNCDAARQLFRVAAGLDSMVVGEAEVQGQVRRAYETAQAAGTTGPLTHRLFGAALAAGKRARTETTIGAGGASVASVAVDLAEEVLGQLPERRVVVIGAGETSELTARALAAKGVTTLFVANRHVDRARSLASRFGGAVLPLDALPEQLVDADMVISSTASPQPILGEDELGQVVEARDERPLLLVDLAVPRDVDPAAGFLPGVTLVDVDGLQRVVERNLEVRSAEATRAEAVVEEEIERFAAWMARLDVLPTVAALRSHGDQVVETVLSENAGRWESASARDLARVEAMARAVANRLLHEPTIRLKAIGEGHGRLELARELFGLDEGDRDQPEGGEGAAEVRRLRRHA
jgi:glutamyl-tRNA reductase